jgi:mevalonate kinase
MAIVASAPRKLILLGEHYVVYGASALCIPIVPQSIVDINAGEGSGLCLESDLGSARLSSRAFEGERKLANLQASYAAFLAYCKSKEMPLHAHIFCSPQMKGLGNSASVAAAMLSGLALAYGKKLTTEQMFSFVQEAEMIAHGGRASGVDARTVCEGSPISFRKDFEAKKYECVKISLSLPKDTCLLVADTYAGKRSSTGDMLAKFASVHGIVKKPDETTAKERGMVIKKYEKIFNAAKKEFSSAGNAIALGVLFNENQLILSEAGMSSDGIERARQVAIDAGALGAKLTGAGGEGGAVLVFAKKSDSPRVREELLKVCANAFEVSIAEGGPEAKGSL